MAEYMRIECPSCFAAYEVPDSLMDAGRVVRCARCGGEWVPVPLEVEPQSTGFAEARPGPEPIADALREPFVGPTRVSAMDRLTAHPALTSSSIRLKLAWAASVLVLVVAVAAALTWRDEIMAAWPPSARAYAVFGLNPEAGETR
jgi:predicted Zn finger-like uncharacterized protein